MEFWWWLAGIAVVPLLLLLTIFLALYTSVPRRRTFSLNKKHAVVTGGSKGIGKQLALCLINKGCNVSIIARNQKDLELASEALQTIADKRGELQKVRFYSQDLSKGYEEVETVMSLAEAELGPVDVLINNAGTNVQDRFDEHPITDFENQMKVNYLSAVYATRCVVGSMKSRRSGHISFVSSVAGQCAIYGYTAYSPSKFAVRGLADVLRMELLPYNINISLLYPPKTDTEGFRVRSLERPEEMRQITDSVGIFTPEEVAEAHVRDIENGHFSTSIGTAGWMLNIATTGGAPEPCIIRAFNQVLLAGLCRLVLLGFLRKFNGIVQKCYEERQKEEAQQESAQ